MASEVTTNATGGASSMTAPTTNIVPTQPSVPTTQTISPGLPGAETVVPQETAPKEDLQAVFDQKLTLITRREREVQKAVQQFKQQQAEMAEALKELNEYRSLKERAKTDPLAFVKHHGIEYKQLTDQVLNDERPTPEMLISNLQAKIEALEAERSDERKAHDQKQRDQLVSTFRDGIKDFVETNGEKFELIKAFGAHDQIFNMIHNHWKETGGQDGGEYLPVEKVAEYLENQMFEEAQKLMTLKKLSPKDQAKVEAALESKDNAPFVPQKPQPRTLTNNLSSSGAQPSGSKPYLRDDESLQEAAKLIRWT